MKIMQEISDECSARRADCEKLTSATESDYGIVHILRHHGGGRGVSGNCLCLITGMGSGEVI